MIPEKIAEKIAEKINSDLVHENLSLRRQLAEAQAEIARLRDEAALLRGDTA